MKEVLLHLTEVGYNVRLLRNGNLMVTRGGLNVDHEEVAITIDLHAEDNLVELVYTAIQLGPRAVKVTGLRLYEAHAVEYL
jgi:hypothetical protein